MTNSPAVISDLKAEGAELFRLLSSLDATDWTTPTPAPGWTVAHQVAHMAATFRSARLTASDPERFGQVAAQADVGFDAAIDAALRPYVVLPPEVLLTRWQEEFTTAADALTAVPSTEVVPWPTRPLRPATLACAGMMELFAHGQDIADALGTHITRTGRIVHLVGFVLQNRDLGYLVRGLTPPREDFWFQLVSPTGARWTFGRPDAPQRITGPALDLCLVATRRRHHEDLSLEATGEHARRWLEIAQAYRGPAGEGRRPGQFAGTRS